MKKNNFMVPLILSALLCFFCFAGCGTAPAPSADGFTVAATTYPVYLLTQMVTEGVENVTLHPIINQPISCPHDYSLSVNDMKLVEQADVLIQNGGGLEPFVTDLLDAMPDLPVVDCSEGIHLLSYQGHDTEAAEPDPHFWLDPHRAAQMVETIGAGLAQADPENGPQYEKNAAAAAQALRTYGDTLPERFSAVTCKELVTFHDGFGYLAEACGLTILKSIEEEAGSEVSAKEISAIAALLKSHQIPAVFCEENGSDSAASAVARETGASIGTLTLMMSGPQDAASPNLYYTMMDENLETLATLLTVSEG